MKDAFADTRTSLVKPRRMLGPDAIACLRAFSQTQTGDRHTYDACRVQRTRSGSISWTINPDQMDFLGDQGAESYGFLIRETLIPAAERLEAYLMSIPEGKRHQELDMMLRKAAHGDGLSFWMLSTRSLRKMLFPDAYNSISDKRRDNVLYHWQPKDVGNAGKPILLQGLAPEQAEAFIRQAVKLTNNSLNINHVTPVTLQ